MKKVASVLTTCLLLPLSLMAVNVTGHNRGFSSKANLEKLESSLLIRARQHHEQAPSIPFLTFSPSDLSPISGATFVDSISVDLPLNAIQFAPEGTPGALVFFEVPSLSGGVDSIKPSYHFQFLTTSHDRNAKEVVRFKVAAQITRDGETIGGLDHFKSLGSFSFLTKHVPKGEVANSYIIKFQDKKNLLQPGDQVLLKFERDNGINGPQFAQRGRAPPLPVLIFLVALVALVES